MNEMKNDNCDGAGPCDLGRVRVLPLSNNPNGGNMILCRCCFEHELAFRRERNRELSADCAFKLPLWTDLEPYGEAKPEMDFSEKCQALAELITYDQRMEWMRAGYTHDEDPARPGCAWVAVVKPGTKYTKINVGDSGKYMVDNATGEIFGIKGYGVIHRGHHYGTLDTIHDWDWSGYTAQLKKAVAA